MEELESSDFIHMQENIPDRSKADECIAASADIMFFIIERLFCSTVGCKTIFKSQKEISF